MTSALSPSSAPVTVPISVPGDPDKWFCLNDNLVTEVTDPLTEISGAPSAYVLFYIRKDIKQLQQSADARSIQSLLMRQLHLDYAGNINGITEEKRVENKDGLESKEDEVVENAEESGQRSCDVKKVLPLKSESNPLPLKKGDRILTAAAAAVDNSKRKTTNGSRFHVTYNNNNNHHDSSPALDDDDDDDDDDDSDSEIEKERLDKGDNCSVS